MPIEYSNREKSYELYRKGKQEGTWDPDHYDLEDDKEDWEQFSEAEQNRFLATCAGFYDGEEDVTRTLAPYMMALDALDNDEMPFDTVQEEMYLAQQVYEEAKHTDLFSRYFEEVFGTQNTDPYREGGYQEHGYSTDNLYDTADELLAAINSGDQQELVYSLGEAYLNYMGIVEAQLARSGYLSFDQMIDLKAKEMGRDIVLESFQESIGKVRQDETRHIENGRWVMKQLAIAEPDIVQDVYEPRIEEYVENRLLADVPMEMPFEGYDQAKIGKQTTQYLQDTIDYIGRERFEEYSDVRQVVQTARAAD
ncbi:ribonucleotide-diphosphate reductase subunit beta [Natronorubrum daqingense]|uniref:Ribonucleoside-diphosphate reductase beta chain n=1 Tax=Natronorubrum daqingense TaxID=588898 RepID=A0A1N6Y8Q0_9EURY|nr:ribonucleotide-diphosphate reductase subunit beta [Natronorubrum daqingense]APX95737.1 ribonucleotide reductase [Natronorubrum daqingense]SIR10953.1 ribonucleoside-diphosphate reductase beta chain [Natronorubrum daqingense]